MGWVYNTALYNFTHFSLTFLPLMLKGTQIKENHLYLVCHTSSMLKALLPVYFQALQRHMNNQFICIDFL